MINEQLEAVNAEKVAHAQEVIAKIAELKAVINNSPELWFGGLPPVYTQVENNVTFAITQLQDIFNIEE